MVTGLKEDTNGQHRGYFLPASLVNKLIVTIIGAIITIGAYMIVWAINDTQWKSVQESKGDILAQQLGLVNAKISTGILPIANERIRGINKRIDELDAVERRLESHLEDDH